MSEEGPPLRAVGAELRSHWAALLALGALALAGLAALGAYGVFYDEIIERERGSLTIDYVFGRGGALLNFQDRLYGVGFEAPLSLAERAFGVEDSRAVYLTRHLLIRLFFLAGGLFAYLLGIRLLGGRLPALFAAALFWLHPWLYAHGFFNSKDIPFLSMFMIALFLIHRAFKRNTLWAFALAGAGAGVLMNVRVAGALFVLAVLALRALDAGIASDALGRKRALLSGCAFAVAAALTLYAAWPYLWGDPIGRFIASFAYMAAHPQDLVETFRGAAVWSRNVPADYVPTWFVVTTLPFALLLGGIGIVALLRRCAARPWAAFRNTRLRFGALLIGAFALPIASVVLSGASLYGGWRQMFFLWAPFSLLAAFGLRFLAGALVRPRLRKAAYASAIAGLGTAAVSIASLHPFQHAYFNFFVDRATPERLNAQYEPRRVANWTYPALRRLLDLRPSAIATADYSQPAVRGLLMLAESDRKRISLIPRALAQFSLRREAPGPEERIIDSESVYRSTLWAIVEEPDENPLIGAYERAVATEPVAQGEWSLYLNRAEPALVYAQDPSERTDENDHFYLFVYPDSPDDLREWERETGRADLSFDLYEHGAAFDGKRVAAVPLPNYEIAGIRTGQIGDAAWEATFPFADPATLRAAFAAAAREPGARAVFNVYVDGDARRLVYAKEPCSPADASPRFFLHIAPERRSDLPDDRREFGFENRGFDFLLRGTLSDGECVAAVSLPDYPIASVRTGQYISGEREIWGAEFSLARGQ